MKILTVCSGNICRSPAMEILLRQAMDDSVEVSSAGTIGMPSWPVSPPMADLLIAHDAAAGKPSVEEPRSGVSKPRLADQVENFRSQRLDEQTVQDADLILTATSAHRGEVLNISPLALRKTMSLGELARLAAGLDPELWAAASSNAERLKILVPAALAARHANPAGAEADDIIDPYQRSNETYQRSYDQIARHINTLATALRPTSTLGDW